MATKTSVDTPNTVYTFDPKADAVVLLKNPNKRFTIWGRPTENMECCREVGVCEDSVLGCWYQEKAKTEYKEEAEPQEIEMRVSSRHLTLASPYWNAVFGKLWGMKRRPDGLFWTETSGFDVTAMLILMNIIHGHSRQVPRQLGLAKLIKFAIAMDFFQCKEICEPYTEVWMERLLAEGWTNWGTPCRATVLLGWIFFIYGHEKGAEYYMRNHDNITGRIDRFFLPRSEEFINKVETIRQDTIRDLVMSIEEVTHHDGPVRRCWHGCHKKLRKQLRREIVKRGYYNPETKTALFDCSVGDIRWFLHTYMPYPVRRHKPPKCKCVKRLRTVLDGIRKKFSDIESLETFIMRDNINHICIEENYINHTCIEENYINHTCIEENYPPYWS